MSSLTLLLQSFTQRTLRRQWLLVISLLLPGVAFTAEPLQFRQRDRVSQAAEGATIAQKAEQPWSVRERQIDWNPEKTALVICDMWDKHWCENATKRVGEMAPRMNEVVSLARDRGVLIIHCPSDTMDFYKDYPQRKLAQSAPVVEAPIALQRWCHIDPNHEPPLPIDDSQGGCDDANPPKSYRAWKKQHAAIEIKDGDAITDDAEAYYLMRQRGIENVIVMGVHTNMCVLGRPFSIRQMVNQGLNVVLMRDMTDTMYDPDARPNVAHSQGTDLVVEHIEKYWCPSVLSCDLTGKPAFAFSDDQRPHVVFLIGEAEYDTKTSLPQFAADQLSPLQMRCTFVHADELDKNRFPLIADVASADLLVMSVRRRLLPTAEMDIVKKYIASGKPIVAIRTASHSFAIKNDSNEAPEGHVAWPTFDEDVFGAKYLGHYGNAKSGPNCCVWKDSEAKSALVDNLPSEEIAGTGTLYKFEKIQPDVQVLLWGRAAGEKEKQPVAWIRTTGPQKVFYTSIGHKQDLQVPAFQDLLRNAVQWGLEK